MSRKRSMLDGILYFINVLFAIGLLLAYLAYYIPPTLLTIFSFAATGFPVLVIVNILFAIYWAIRLKRKILLPLIFLAIGYMHLPRMFRFGTPTRVVEAGESLKVMSYNVRMFNAYRWVNDEEIETKIIDVVEGEDPDVLLVQEYHEEPDKPLHGLQFPYHHSVLNNSGKKVGLMIFSKFPITGSQKVEMTADTLKQTAFQLADIEWQGKSIRFINVHLASVGLENADYDLLENPDYENREKVQHGLKTIIKRLHRSYRRRSLQTTHIVDAIRDSPLPVVLAGDFNDVPQSYVYHRIDLELKDSFLNGGEHFGRTYINSPLPLRIDYIFHSEDLNSFNFKVIDKELSDHYPLISELEFRSPEN